MGETQSSASGSCIVVYGFLHAIKMSFQIMSRLKDLYDHLLSHDGREKSLYFPSVPYIFKKKKKSSYISVFVSKMFLNLLVLF